jgi:hypothetical protein
LVDLLNREYADFIALASSLDGTQEGIAQNHNAIRTIRAATLAALQRVDGKETSPGSIPCAPGNVTFPPVLTLSFHRV